MARGRHVNKDIEAILAEAEGHGWVVIVTGGYWKVRCVCPLRHQRSVHKTPSDPNYPKNLRGWLRRQPCWETQR